MALTAYLQQTSRILHDPQNQNFLVPDLTAFINLARGQIANSSGAIRKLNIVSLTNAVETYALPNPNGVGVGFAGVGQAMSIMGISVPWGTYKPTLDRYSFADFQAYFRLFSGTVSGFPECWAQLGDAGAASVYFFPIPSQAFASEWDCTHTTLALASDSDPEALPYPYTDAVPYYAAYFALINAQRYQEANAMLQQNSMLSAIATKSVKPIIVGTAYPGIAGDRSGGP